MRREYDLQRETLGEELYFYTIFKLLFDTETGLGHSVILRFDALKNDFDVIDPQKDRITPVEQYKQYLCSPLADMYSGASIIVHTPPEHELENTNISRRRGSRRRGSTSNRRRHNNRGNNHRSTRRRRNRELDNIINYSNISGGLKINNIRDSDFSHLSKKQEQILQKASNKEDSFFNKIKFK